MIGGFNASNADSPPIIVIIAPAEEDMIASTNCLYKDSKFIDDSKFEITILLTLIRNLVESSWLKNWLITKFGFVANSIEKLYKREN